MSGKGNRKNPLQAVVVIILIVSFALVGLGSIFGSSTHNPQPQRQESVVETSVPCITADVSALPDLAHLEIIINGQIVPLPANIGVEHTCTRALHTEDSSGFIYIDSARSENFTLNDFFDVWGVPFSENEFLGFSIDEGHELTITVNGEMVSGNEDIELESDQQIIIEYREIVTGI